VQPELRSGLVVEVLGRVVLSIRRDQQPRDSGRPIERHRELEGRRGVRELAAGPVDPGSDLEAGDLGQAMLQAPGLSQQPGEGRLELVGRTDCGAHRRVERCPQGRRIRRADGIVEGPRSSDRRCTVAQWGLFVSRRYGRYEHSEQRPHGAMGATSPLQCLGGPAHSCGSALGDG
jgi:hypothetical protein